jgi:two-component system response regulator
MDNVEILLVEDSAGDAVLIRQIVSEVSAAVSLHIARDGEQALMMLGDSDFRPAFIILDLNIPRTSGLKLLERWKSQQIPVVVFSSSLNDGERARVLELGAREFIQKPTDIDAFTQVVRGMVERYAGPGKKSAGSASA